MRKKQTCKEAIEKCFRAEVQAQKGCSVLSLQEQPHASAIKKAVVSMQSEKEADTRPFGGDELRAERRETALSSPCSLGTWQGGVSLEWPSGIKQQHNMCKPLGWNKQSNNKQNRQRILSCCRIWNYSWAHHMHCRADPQPLEQVCESWRNYGKVDLGSPPPPLSPWSGEAELTIKITWWFLPWTRVLPAHMTVHFTSCDHGIPRGQGKVTDVMELEFERL